MTDNYSNSTPVLAIGNGTNAVSVSSLVTGLIAATDYHFRLVASNSGGTNYGADQSFTTITSLPAVPSLLSPGWGLGRFSVSVVTETGATYHLERKNSLSDPEWVTVSIVSGNGLARSLSDQGATDAQSFYRVRVE